MLRYVLGLGFRVTSPLLKQALDAWAREALRNLSCWRRGRRNFLPTVLPRGFLFHRGGYSIKKTRAH